MKYIFTLLLSCYISVAFSGIGGGGAMSGISFDPKNDNHLFIGTSAGLLYESYTQGKKWRPISQSKIAYSNNISQSYHMGFSHHGIMYWSGNNCSVKASLDLGKNWYAIHSLEPFFNINCNKSHRKIQYWSFSKILPNQIFLGTNKGLLFSKDLGNTWQQYFKNQKSLATKVIAKNTLIHVTNKGVYQLNLETNSQSVLFKKPLSIAAIGLDHKGLTIAAIEADKAGVPSLWIKAHKSNEFIMQKQPVGQFLKMAQNNSSTIYFSQAKPNPKNIWRSLNAGKSFELILKDEENKLTNSKLPANPMTSYVEFEDTAYHDFQVAPYNASLIGLSSTLSFILSNNGGKNWHYPYLARQTFTPMTKSSWYQNSHLNPNNIYFIKKHPTNKNYLIAGVNDIGCILSLNNGKTWRLCNVDGQNSIYDIAFNPSSPNELYAATSEWPNYPQGWYADIINVGSGGIFFSTDYGLNWQRISPQKTSYKNPYLSLAIDFKKTPCEIYSGTQGKGIIYSPNCGESWQRFNKGFEPLSSSNKSIDRKGALIFPSIKISPINGDVYALHSGNRFWQDDNRDFVKYTGLYKLDKKSKKWHQLGRPTSVITKHGLNWKYPVNFDVDWYNPSHLYLIDISTSGAKNVSGLWKSVNNGKTWKRILIHNQLRQIKIQGSTVSVSGWQNKRLNQKAFYQSFKEKAFQSIDLNLPLSKITDFIIENDEISWLSTFGAGLFYIHKTPEPLK